MTSSAACCAACAGFGGFFPLRFARLRFLGEDDFRSAMHRIVAGDAPAGTATLGVLAALAGQPRRLSPHSLGKAESQRLIVPLRLMVTSTQRELIDEALRLEGGDFSEWARGILLRAAEKRVAQARARTKATKN